MAAHMGKLGLRLVFEIWVVLRHRQCIHIGSECQSFYSFTRGWPRPFNVNDEPGTCTILDAVRRNANFEQLSSNSLLRLVFFESDLGVGVYLFSHGDHFLRV